MEYESVVGETKTETVIEKSRFLAYAAHAESEEEARAYLARLRAEHPLATHICYGYISDKLGNGQRFSDDGEPQGTAGMPILGVVKAKNLRETVVAVVRYFGGVKLGAGGLTRAYAGCAADCLSAADVRRYSSCTEITLTVGYAEVNAALRFLEGEAVIGKRYGDGAEFVVAVPESEEKTFAARAADCLNGRVKLSAGARRYYPFPKD